MAVPQAQISVFGGEKEYKNSQLAIALQNKGVTLLNEGKFVEAKEVAEQNVALREKGLGKQGGANSLWTATAYQLLGQVETELKNYTRGLELCKKSAAIREKAPGQENDAACARDDAARCLEGLGKLKEAGEFRKGGPKGKQGIICGSTPCSKFAENSQKFNCCSKCKAVWYCSKPCQKQDWKRHKKHCKDVA